MMYNLKVDWNELQGIISQVLKDDYYSLKKDIADLHHKLEVKGKLQDFEKEDLAYNLKILKALRKVHNYYSAHTDHINE